MNSCKVELTKQDIQILEAYKTTVKALASYLGESYEIILHSLEDPEHSVIEIANGFHTGRAIGAPITDLAINWLKKIEESDSEIDSYSYYSKSKKGEPLKSSTIAIRGEKNRIIGLLCINCYLGTPFFKMIADMMPHESTNYASENFATSSVTIESEIEKAKEVIEATYAVSERQSKKEIIRILYQRNVFDIKNAVEQVAEQLGLSHNTVYFHLRNIAKEN